MRTGEFIRNGTIEFATLSPRVQEIVDLAITHGDLLSHPHGVSAEFHCPRVEQSHRVRVKLKVTLHLQRDER